MNESNFVFVIAIALKFLGAPGEIGLRGEPGKDGKDGKDGQKGDRGMTKSIFCRSIVEISPTKSVCLYSIYRSSGFGWNTRPHR